MDEAVTLDDPASAVREARRVTATVLGRWCGERRHVDDAVLVVSEVVTNAVRHGGGGIWLRLFRLRRGVRVEVHDNSPVEPELLAPAALAERGRGMQIVARLATRWGTRRVRGGKVVWADLPCELVDAP